MDETEQMFERTKQLLGQVNALREAIDAFRTELIAYGKSLRQKPTPAPAAAKSDPGEDDGPPTQPSAKERRTSTRRKGPPVPLLLSYSKTGSAPFPGWVVDCSPTGVGIMVEQLVAVGAVLSVRPTNAPQRFRWVQVEVRNCHTVRNRWNLGCKFVRDLPIEDLDLFKA